MFDKLLGKSKKVSFEIPDRTFTYDSKTVSKLSSKDLILLATDQDKYISIILKKLDSVRDEYGRMTEKVEELTEKNQIINAETVRMSNEQEELNIKFMNLENSLEIVLREKEMVEKEFKGKYLKLKGIVEGESSGNVGAVTGDLEVRLKEIIHQSGVQSSVFKNIEVQNNKLKEKIEELEEVILGLEKGKGEVEQRVKGLVKEMEEKKKEMERVREENNQLKARESVIGSSQGENKEKIQENRIQQPAKIESVVEKVTVKQKQEEENTQPQESKQQPSQSRQTDLLNRISILQQQLTKYSLLQQLLIDSQHKISPSHPSTLPDLSLQKRQSNADTLQQRILTLINYLKQERETTLQLEKINQQLKASIREMESLLKNKSVESQEIASEKKQREDKYLAEKIELLKNHEELDKALALKNQEMEELVKKSRKQETELNTSLIKMDSLKKSIDKLTDQNKSYKQAIEKKYQQSVTHIQKSAQLEEKVKEYKKQIQRLKMEKLQLEQQNQVKMNQYTSKISESQKNIEIIKKESVIAQEAKEYEMREKIKRLEEQVEDLVKENENLVRKREDDEENDEKNKRLIRELSEKREQAIIEIERLEKLSSGKVGEKEKGREGEKVKEVEKGKEEVVDRGKKVAEKSFKALGIILKLLESLYKEFVNDYLSEIKEVRVQKLENAINQLITKATDMKDIFRDYM